MSLLVLLVCQFVFDQCPQHSIVHSIEEKENEEDQIASRHRKVHHPLPDEEEKKRKKTIESI